MERKPVIKIMSPDEEGTMERLYDAIRDYNAYCEIRHYTHLYDKEKEDFKKVIFARYLECRSIGLVEESEDLLVGMLGKPDERH